jgi:hypothetical protein
LIKEGEDRGRMQIDKEVRAELREEKVMEHVRWLTEKTPRRLSGTGDDRKAAEYICDQMSKYGLEAQLLEFETFNSTPLHSELRVLDPVSLLVQSLPCGHIQSTPPEGMTTELVYVGPGAMEDYEGKDVIGKAVLVEVSYSPPTPEKARIAAMKGAAAMICSNWGEDQEALCNRALKAVWGTPTVHNFNEIPKIAGLSISRRAGEFLRKLSFENPSVKVLIKAESLNKWEKLTQPLAILRGRGGSESFLLVSGHLDAWEPGVTCNATGNGVMLELARVFSKYRNSLSRDIYFVFWNGHEIAEAAGSTWFVDHYWDLLRDHCIGYFNIDSPGMKGGVRYEAVASRELIGFVKTTLPEVLGEEPGVSDLRKIGDQSFLGIGVPSVSGRMALSPEDVRRNHGATLGWWNHTIEDTLDKVDCNNLKKDLAADATLILNWVNSEWLPYDFTTTAKTISQNLHHLHSHAGHLIELKSLAERADLLCSRISELNAMREQISSGNLTGNQKDDVNRTFMKLSRILTGPFQTNCSPYDQDSYGLTILSKPIPLLHPVLQLKETDRSKSESILLLTTLIKNRNRVSDALHQALEWVETTLNGYPKEDRIP